MVFTQSVWSTLSIDSQFLTSKDSGQFLRTCFLLRSRLLLADSGKPCFKRRGIYRADFNLSFGWLKVRGNRCLFKIWTIIHLQWIILSFNNEKIVFDVDGPHQYFFTFFFPHVYSFIFSKMWLVLFINILIIKAKESILSQNTFLHMCWFSLIFLNDWGANKNKLHLKSQINFITQ